MAMAMRNAHCGIKKLQDITSSLGALFSEKSSTFLLLAMKREGCKPASEQTC